MECGWISIHRKIKDHWVWDEKPFSKGQAWIDILLMANHADKKILLGNELIEVKRGSFITSEKKLMENWGWGKEKVRKFLQVLQDDGMIEKKSDHKKTTINVVNYGFFQNSNSQSRPLSDHFQTTNRPITDHRQTVSRPSADTNNNDNNKNNENNGNNDNNSFGDKSPKPSRPNYSNSIKEIVDYLNYICGTNYKSTTKATAESIKARLKEGFTVDDFKTVIDKKINEWGNDPKMVQYLRPQTLFGSKFEGYLNQIATDGRQLSETDKALLRWMSEPQEENQSNALMLEDDIF